MQNSFPLRHPMCRLPTPQKPTSIMHWIRPHVPSAEQKGWLKTQLSTCCQKYIQEYPHIFGTTDIQTYDPRAPVEQLASIFS